jgi:hypothetical protein
MIVDFLDKDSFSLLWDLHNDVSSGQFAFFDNYLNAMAETLDFYEKDSFPKMDLYNNNVNIAQLPNVNRTMNLPDYF